MLCGRLLHTFYDLFQRIRNIDVFNIINHFPGIHFRHIEQVGNQFFKAFKLVGSLVDKAGSALIRFYDRLCNLQKCFYGGEWCF